MEDNTKFWLVFAAAIVFTFFIVWINQNASCDTFRDSTLQYTPVRCLPELMNQNGD